MTARLTRLAVAMTALGLASSAFAQSSDQSLRAHAACDGFLREAVSSGAVKNRQQLKPYVVKYHKCMSSILTKPKNG